MRTTIWPKNSPVLFNDQLVGLTTRSFTLFDPASSLRLALMTPATSLSSHSPADEVVPSACLAPAFATPSFMVLKLDLFNVPLRLRDALDQLPIRPTDTLDPGYNEPAVDWFLDEAAKQGALPPHEEARLRDFAGYLKHVQERH